MLGVEGFWCVRTHVRVCVCVCVCVCVSRLVYSKSATVFELSTSALSSEQIFIAPVAYQEDKKGLIN